MRIKDWPEGDRPREMFLEKGPEALSDAALLAILTVEDTPPFVFSKLQKN
jgi:DNA repair protein RadC